MKAENAVRACEGGLPASNRQHCGGNMSTTLRMRLLGAFVCIITAGSVHALPFTTGYTDGTSWNAVYAQGFSPSLSPTPNPGSAAGDPAYLNSFSFFKSGNPDSSSNIQLVILNNIFANLQGLTTSSPAVVGVSANTIASTAALPTGTPETFLFNNLPLTYGNDYGAVAANIDGSGNITPVLISALITTYVETPPGSGSFHPATNYGTESQFQYATSNFITTNSFGSFFNTFSFAGDANFVASLDTAVPEPASLAVFAASAALLLSRRRA
jgi:hypothetical protein